MLYTYIICACINSECTKVSVSCSDHKPQTRNFTNRKRCFPTLLLHGRGNKAINGEIFDIKSSAGDLSMKGQGP